MNRKLNSYLEESIRAVSFYDLSLDESHDDYDNDRVRAYHPPHKKDKHSKNPFIRRMKRWGAKLKGIAKDNYHGLGHTINTGYHAQQALQHAQTAEKLVKHDPSHPEVQMHLDRANKALSTAYRHKVKSDEFREKPLTAIPEININDIIRDKIKNVQSLKQTGLITV